MGWDGSERRRFTRVNFPCRIVLYTPKRDRIDTVAINISEWGVGLALREKLEVSSIIGLEIYEIKKRPILCNGFVKWVKGIESSYVYIGNLLFNTGIQFNQPIPAIRNLVASFFPDKKEGYLRNKARLVLRFLSCLKPAK